MSGRKINALEQRLHQAALADPKLTLTQKECNTLIPDDVARTSAINFLLQTGLFKVLKDAKGAVSYRAVMKKELEIKKDMSGEESMVLSHIQASGNEGIWTKHLKAKTELHQTVIDRCIKALTQKQLIKAVKSVKYPTRKIYMLSHLEPSVEMTGGPWYTDNELDTEFIKLLCSACLRFIKDRSQPKQKSSSSESSNSNLLYPISAAPMYPTAQQILVFLSKSRITETQLTVEHVEMLLNVLVLDGDVEKIPAFGAAMWASSTADQDDEDEDRDRKKSKRKEGSSKRKRSRSTDSESDDRSSKRSKRKRKSRDSSDEESEVEHSRKKKRKSSKDSDDDDEDSSDARSSKRKKRQKRKRDSSQSASDASDSETESEDDRRRKKSKSRSKSKSEMRSSSPADIGGASMDDDYGAYVYRAVKQEKAVFGLSQTPCTRCPTFDFCKDKGPVNPQECKYYGEWLSVASVARE